MSLNRVVLIGRLGADPEHKYTPQGKQVATFRIGVNRIKRRDQPEAETDWFHIVAWEQTAEFVSKYLTKGRLVSVDGRLQTRSWEDQATGQKRTVWEIVAEHVEGLDKIPTGGEGEEGMSPPRSAAPRPAAPSSSRAPVHDDDTDDADPFADE